MAEASTQAQAASGVQMGANLGATYSNLQAIRSQSLAERDRMKFNARIQQRAADQAVERGDRAGGQLGNQVADMRGAQGVAAASQGVMSNKGSAARIAASTSRLGAADVTQIRVNALREAWGHKVSAQESLSNARLNKLAARNKTTQTMMAGGAQFAKDLNSTLEIRKKYGVGYDDPRVGNPLFDRESGSLGILRKGRPTEEF